MKRINSRIETVQLFLRSFDTGKLSIETKLPIHCTRDSWKSTLEFLFQFVRSRRTLHGTSASYSRFSRFEPRVIRFLFFRTPFVSSSRFLLKRNEGGHPSPPPPFFPAVFHLHDVHAISRDSCRRHGRMEREQPSPLIIDQLRIVDYQFGIQAILVYRPRPRLCLYLDNTNWPHAKD